MGPREGLKRLNFAQNSLSGAEPFQQFHISRLSLAKRRQAKNLVRRMQVLVAMAEPVHNGVHAKRLQKRRHDRDRTADAGFIRRSAIDLGQNPRRDRGGVVAPRHQERIGASGILANLGVYALRQMGFDMGLNQFKDAFRRLVGDQTTGDLRCRFSRQLV